MAFNKLNIVRDCWWLHSSGTYTGIGDYYLVDENMQQSTMEHGLYKSLNSSDSEYINMYGSGYYAPTYYCRVDTTNIVPSSIVVSARADNASTAFVEINGQTLGAFGFWDSLSTQDQVFHIDRDHDAYQAIIEGRLNANYDNFSIRLVNSGDVNDAKLYNLEVFYSGDNTWTNYTAGLPNVESEVCYPSQLHFRGGSVWENQEGETVDPSGWYHINTSGVTADNTYIEHTTYPDLIRAIYLDGRRPKRFDIGPQGGLGISFDTEAIEPLTQVTRAQLTLRMSLPPSGAYENIRDTFEINGYNARYKEQDYKNEMPEEIGSIRAKWPRYGYFAYGVGDIVEQSGFMNYQVDLDFINPQRADYDYSTIEHRNIDIFSGMNFQVVGLPSGTQVSSAHLNIEYLPNDHLGLYTVGGVAVIRHWVDSYVDIGGDNTAYFGDGAWQHRGNLHEGTIFDAFYKFDEIVGSTTWPVSLNAASGAYGYYTNGITEEPVYGDGDEIIDIIYDWDARDPTRKHIYRNPVRTEFGETYDPTHYLHMIYNQSCFVEWDVHDPDASAYNPLTTNIYFEDRVTFGPSFTLYFMLYREPTNEGQQFGQFFTRAALGSASAVDYEILGFLEPEKLSVAIKDVNEVVHTLSVDLEAYSLEPILVWVTCDYDDVADETTFKLDVHPKIKNFFYQDWLHAEETFNFARRQLTNVYTCLGPLYSPDDLDQQLAFSQYMSWVSFCEFGWADSAIVLDYQTSTEDVRRGYDTSRDNDKRFLASRLATGEYLHGRRKDDDTIGGDPIDPGSSGWLLPNEAITWGGLEAWQYPERIKFENDGPSNSARQQPPWGLLGGRPGDWLVGYDWQIEVPSGQIPVGVEVQIRPYCNPSYAVHTHRIQLGTIVGTIDGPGFLPAGTRQENTGPVEWRFNAQVFTYGAPNSTWGIGSGLTTDLVESTNFAVGLQAESWQGQEAWAWVDWIKLRVYYSGEAGVETIDTFKSLHWPVTTGSGVAEHSTTYLIDNWRYDEYSMYNPVTTAGTHNIVHPSAIKVELDTEHITDHPSGVDIICDFEFDTGATDNWKVFRSKLTLGSGDYDGIVEITGFDKHINMGSEEIRYSDIDQINLKLTTKYADLGETEYHGDLKVKGLRVYFDSYSASVTGINVLDLYVEGGIGESNNDLDLYLLAADVDSNDVDLFIHGIPYYASGEMPLFTEGMVPTTNEIPLYIKGIPFYASGDMTLFTKAITWTSMPLYIEGLDPPEESGNIPLYTWGTPVGVGGLYKNMHLYVGGVDPAHMLPLYLHNEGPYAPTHSGDMNLFINSASGTNDSLNLYTSGHDLPTNTVNMYIVSGSGHNDSVNLYTYGSGLPETKTTTIYTHGY